MNWFKKLIGQAPGKQEEKPGEPIAPAAGGSAPDAVQEINLREGSPEFHLFIASATLDTGTDLAHGAAHLASLLAVDPRRADWQALAVRYLDQAGGDVDALLPVGDKRFADSEALRAWFWQRQGKTAEALDLLAQVSRVSRHALYLDAWALDWLERDCALESVGEATMMQLMATALNSVAEASESSAATVRAMGRWAALGDRAGAACAPSPTLLLVRAGLHRKAGQFEAALAITGPIEKATSIEQANAIGLLLRCMRRFDEAEQAFIHANSFDPQDITPKLEAGDTCFEAGNWQKALDWYEAVLAVVPDQAWALPSSWYCRYKRDGDQAWFERLWEAMGNGDDRAHQLVFRERGRLAQSSDASANLLRQLREKWQESGSADSGGSVKIEVNTLEAPSVRLAFALEFAARKPAVVVEFNCGALPAVDPRLALAPVDYPLWTYHGTLPLAALPPPAASVRDAIAALALAPYHPHQNWAQASHVAARFGTRHVRDLLAVMVYPPPLPPDLAALEWLPRVQLAAAQVLGQIDSGWEGSERRRALVSVLFGPMDWTTCAAIRVLAWIASTEPACATDIMQLFAQMERHIPRIGHWDWVGLLYQQWLEIPALFENERKELHRKLAAHEGDAAQD